MEFCHQEFNQFLEKQGIIAERTNTYSPEQNGVSERFNYTALDAVKAMLAASSLSQKFWAEALFCFTYVWNRICHHDRNQTPFELYGNRKPSVKHLRTFGSAAFVGIAKQKRSKLQMRTRKGILVGYAMKTKGYRIFLPDEQKVIETINVKIMEGDISSGAVLDPVQPERSIYRYETDPSPNVIPESEDESTGEPGESSEGKMAPETDGDEPEPPAPEEDIVWLRRAVTRKDKSRRDIYYRVIGSKRWHNTLKSIKKFCQDKKIDFNPSMFNFSGTDAYSGVVLRPTESCSQVNS